MVAIFITPEDITWEVILPPLTSTYNKLFCDASLIKRTVGAAVPKFVITRLFPEVNPPIPPCLPSIVKKRTPFKSTTAVALLASMRVEIPVLGLMVTLFTEDAPG